MTKRNLEALCKELGITIPTGSTVRKRAAEEKCVFCGESYENIGNNPAPVIDHEDAYCCNFCNGAVVLRVRLKITA